MSKSALLLIALTAGMTAAGNLLIREGIVRAGGVSFSPATFLEDLLSVIRQPLLDIGVLLYGMASIVWFKVIATENLSTSYPLVVAMTFLLVSSGCALWFREVISLQKIVGMVLILLGIIVVSSS
uniref:EamA-like transporter family protein n=1 Tax=Desulfacinum infernum TaxID=35837 RepID=A0A832A3G0_9BACT